MAFKKSLLNFFKCDIRKESYRPIFLINIREGRGGERKEREGKGGLTDPTLLIRLHPFPTAYHVTFVIIQATMYFSVY